MKRYFIPLVMLGLAGCSGDESGPVPCIANCSGSNTIAIDTQSEGGVALVEYFNRIKISMDGNDHQDIGQLLDEIKSNPPYGEYFSASTNRLESPWGVSPKFLCPEPGYVNSFAVRVTFEKGATVTLVGWPESMQAVDGVTQYGLGWLPDTCVADGNANVRSSYRPDEALSHITLDLRLTNTDTVEVSARP